MLTCCRAQVVVAKADDGQGLHLGNLKDRLPHRENPRLAGIMWIMADSLPDEEILFSVETPLGFRVQTTVGYWTIITTIKHPVMLGREADVQATLRAPDEVRLSQTDEQIYLFYRSDGTKRWVCAVTKRLNGEGFLVTAYRTSKIKEGIHLWPK